MEEKWKKIDNKITEFFYGERGIETTAYADINLETYNWNLDEIIEIIKEIKKIEEELTEEQKKSLDKYREYFLEIDNGKNGIKQMYNRIVDMYKNIEEY